MTQALMTTDDVLGYLQISRRTLTRLLSLGDFPEAAKVGAQNRWTRQQIDAWVRSGGRARRPMGRPRKASTPAPAMRCPARKRLEASVN